MKKRKLTALICSASVAFSLFGIDAGAENACKGVAIINTNDVHCGFDADEQTLGAADLAAYKSRLESEGYDVILADAGDFIQGGVIGTLSEGEYPLKIMNKLGYDVAVPGNHEFDYGMDNFFMLAENADFSYLSCNFTDLETGEKIFDGYKVIEADMNGEKLKIGFVGLTTPETPQSSNPSYFKNENGEMRYGFCGGDDGSSLYSAVQEAVDGALKDGADVICAVGHIGDYVYDERWSSAAVIENVSGIDIFIDGHAHSVLDETVKGKDGSETMLVSTGTKLENIGTIFITGSEASPEFSYKQISKADFTLTSDENSDEYKAYEEMSSYLAELEEKNSEITETVVAKTAVDLTINDPITGERAVRSAETNMGDLVADAYRAGTGADIAFVNGGGVRTGISSGDITYGDIIEVQPFGNSLCVVEASGQQILDCLEMGAVHCPEESGGFMQVSGLTYEIHSYIPSSVTTDANGTFTGVDGEYRVKNVLVDGEPLELDKTYTFASHDYMLLNGGDGMSMFKDCNMIAKEIILDNQALIEYIKDDLGGTVGEGYSDPNGGGRITVVSEAPSDNSAENPHSGNTSSTVMIAVMTAAAALALSFRNRVK